MDRRLPPVRSQPLLPQQTYSIDSGSDFNVCSSPRKLSALPRIASRPKSAFIPSRTPSERPLAVADPDQRRAPPLSRERPKSAMPCPVSAKTLSRNAGAPPWNGYGSSHLLDFGNLDTDILEGEDDDEVTSLQDLLTCSALNIEAKPHKPDWNLGGHMPKFHCPRCRDHWYGLASHPCDEVQRRASRGVWQTSQVVTTGKMKERPKEDNTKEGTGEEGYKERTGEEGYKGRRYRSKSAYVRRKDENVQLPGNPPKRGSPTAKAFMAVKDSTGNHGSRGVELTASHEGAGDDDGGDGVPSHERKGYNPNSPPRISYDEVTLLALSECKERLQDPINMFPRRQNEAPPHSTASGTFLEGWEEGAAAEYTLSRTLPTLPTSQQSKGSSQPMCQLTTPTALPSTVSDNGLQLDHLKVTRKTDHTKVSVLSSSSSSNVTPTSSTHQNSIPINSSARSDHSEDINTPSMAPTLRSSEVSDRALTNHIADKAAKGLPLTPHVPPGQGLLVPPIPPRRHTVDTLDLVRGLRLTRPWTFSYHTQGHCPNS